MKKIIFLALVIMSVASISFAADDTCKEGVCQAKLSDMTIVSGDTATMFIYDNIIYQDKMLKNDLAVIRGQTSITDVHIWVNSPGGLAHTGFAVADILNSEENKDLKFTCRADGMIASIAVPIFLACDDRVIGPSAIFMVHEARLTDAQNVTRGDAKAAQEMLEMQLDRYVDVLVKETTIKDRNEWEDMIRKTTWINAKRAVEIGLAHKIE